MHGLYLASVLQLAIVAAPAGDTYAEAHKMTMQSGCPMVVMVGADWCPACQRMKEEVLPQVRRQGLLRKVAFAIVNLDREQELGSQLVRGGPIPQLLCFRRTSDGWRVRRLIGAQSVETVESFIKDGAAAEATAKQTETKLR